MLREFQLTPVVGGAIAAEDIAALQEWAHKAAHLTTQAPLNLDIGFSGLHLWLDQYGPISLLSNACLTYHYAKVKPSGTQTVAADGADHDITFATTVYDSAALISGASIIVPRTGLGIAVAYLPIQSADFSAGGFLGLNIEVNGTAIDPGELKVVYAGTSSQNVCHRWEGIFTAGDVITATLKNGTAVNPLTVLATAYLSFSESYPVLTVARRDVTVLSASEEACENDPEDCCVEPGSGGSGENVNFATFVNVTTATGTEAAEPEIPLPPGIDENNLMLMVITGCPPTAAGNLTVTGWTELTEGFTGQGNYLGIFYKLYAPGDTDPPVITAASFGATTYFNAAILNFGNVNTSDPIGGLGTLSGNGLSLHVGPIEGLTTIYNQQVVMVYARMCSGGAWDNATVPTDQDLIFREVVDVPGANVNMGIATALNPYVGALTLPSEIVTVNGGADGEGLGIMLTINGSGTSGGVGGGTESCPECSGGIAASEYTFTVAGASNDSCSDCTNLNATKTLVYTSYCYWKTATFTLCSAAGAYWEMSNVGAGQTLILKTGGGVAVANYSATGTWDCLSNRVFNLASENGSCNGLPATITISPV